MPELEFLDEEDKAIVRECMQDIEVDEWARFWSHKELQLDGSFYLPQLRALVLAMERMEKRRLTKRAADAIEPLRDDEFQSWHDDPGYY